MRSRRMRGIGYGWAAGNAPGEQIKYGWQKAIVLRAALRHMSASTPLAKSLPMAVRDGQRERCVRLGGCDQPRAVPCPAPGRRRPHRPDQPQRRVLVAPPRRPAPAELDPHRPPRRHQPRPQPRREDLPQPQPTTARITTPGTSASGETPQQPPEAELLRISATPSTAGRVRPMRVWTPGRRWAHRSPSADPCHATAARPTLGAPAR
jgi:hypothetical protein